MAFLSAIGLMAFASVTEASAGPEELAPALVDKPTESARKLLGRAEWNYSVLDECSTDEDCVSDEGRYCESVPIEDSLNKLVGASKRCVNMFDKFLILIQENHYGIPTLANMLAATLVHWVNAFGDLPTLKSNSGLERRNTPGDIVKLVAMFMQFVSMFIAISEKNTSAEKLTSWRFAATALWFWSLFGYLYGVKAASKLRKVNILAAKVNVVVAGFSSLTSFILIWLAQSDVLLFYQTEEEVFTRQTTSRSTSRLSGLHTSTR